MERDGESRRNGSSHSKHKKHKREHKKRKEKSKDRRKRRSRHSSPDSSDYSSDQAALPTVDLNTQLAMGRAAARALREILANNYELKNEIRQIARHLDEGNALNVSGIPDAFLRHRLSTLFNNLVQLKTLPDGSYIKKANMETISSFIAPILGESPETLSAYKIVKQKTPCLPTEVQNFAQDAEGSGQLHGKFLTPEAEILEVEKKTMPEHSFPNEMDENNDGSLEDGRMHDEALLPKKRVLGPAMPPPEVLQQQADAVLGIDVHVHSGDDNEDILVGPPPPEFVESITDTATMSDRVIEVNRILQVIEQHEASNNLSTMNSELMTKSGASAIPHPPDAYDILGVHPSAGAGEIKKRYWKLSLLIHPDKCDHPKASIAFQALSIAAKDLQDHGARAAVDGRREAAELQQFTREFAAQQERERQWRIARGQGTKEDFQQDGNDTYHNTQNYRQREAWMTELPTAKAAGAQPPTGHQTAFNTRPSSDRNHYDVQGRTAWTRNPLDPEGVQVHGPSSSVLRLDALAPPNYREKKSHVTAAQVDEYNTIIRSKSLLEKHLEKQQRGRGENESKKRKKDDREECSVRREPSPSHPWRPFDREKDLEIKPKGVNDPKELLKNIKGLSSRFGSGNQQGNARSFL